MRSAARQYEDDDRENPLHMRNSVLERPPVAIDDSAPMGRPGTSVISSFDELDALIPEWTRLFACSGAQNPFAHPQWMVTWAHHFVSPDQLYVITVRDVSGSLIGIAPLYRHCRRLAPGLIATHLRLFGTGRHAHLTELPQILTAPDMHRKVLRDIIHFVFEDKADWDWMEISLTPEQGWFEPQWLPHESVDAGSFTLHKAARAFTILPLAVTWDDLRTTLKRNVKESIRRSSNRLEKRSLTPDTFIPRDPASFDFAMNELVALHRERARVRAKTAHRDYFLDPRALAFMLDAARRMFSAGHLTPYLLQVNGAPVAAQLILNANRTTYFGISGFDPAWWQYSVATNLMVECLREAISRGDNLANLSLGPDVPKVRWSEQIEVHHDFMVVNSRRRSRLAFNLFWQLSAVTRLRQERIPGIAR